MSLTLWRVFILGWKSFKPFTSSTSKSFLETSLWWTPVNTSPDFDPWQNRRTIVHISNKFSVQHICLSKVIFITFFNLISIHFAESWFCFVQCPHGESEVHHSPFDRAMSTVAMSSYSLDANFLKTESQGQI